MSGCFFLLGLLFLIIGLVNFLSPVTDERPVTPTVKNPNVGFPARAENSRPAQPPGAVRQNAVVGGSMSSTPPSGAPSGAPSLGGVKIGSRIRVRHPVQGELTVYVMGRAVYDELWQTQRGPQSPWVPTGNAFSGFWLETNLFLLNWQNRTYLLDDATQLSDAEIQRSFAPHARKFAQSDQTADVYFAYPPASWHIDDIGKFRIRAVEGEGLRNVPGSTGRFVHCSGDNQRALVLEDYEGGGGQDVVWTGFQINAEDIVA